MSKIRYMLVGIAMLFTSAASAEVQISIGIDIPIYPQLAVVPGYPVYYAPQLEGNYFFYDGVYWVYQDDYWYASSWYNGPWELVSPEDVPVFVLRVPVRYYRRPPTFFFGWRSDAPPHWGDHWGHDWEQHRRGWNRWDRSISYRPAPLPVYQQQYSGNRYPRQMEQQHELQKKNYGYQPRDPKVQRNPQAQHRQQVDSRSDSHNPAQRPAVPRSHPAQIGNPNAPAAISPQPNIMRNHDRGQPQQKMNTPHEQRPNIPRPEVRQQGRDEAHEPKPRQEHEQRQKRPE